MKLTTMRRAAVLFATLALASTALVAVDGSAQGSTPSTNYAATIFNMINTERKAHGVPAVTYSIRLENAAARHNYWMATRNILTHRVSGEHSLGYRVTAAGYIWSALGENLGVANDYSMSSISKLQSMMYAEGPGGGHYVNIMNSAYHNVGVSVRIDTVHHKAWLTVDFGHLR